PASPRARRACRTGAVTVRHELWEVRMSWLREVHEAWRQHVRTGRIDRTRLRRATARAWERSAAGGARTERPLAESLSPGDTERLLARRAELVTAARPYMEALSVASGGVRHAVMLGDAEAT